MSDLVTQVVAEVEVMMQRHAQMLGAGGFAAIYAMALGYGVGNAAPNLANAKQASDYIASIVRENAVQKFLDKGKQA